MILDEVFHAIRIVQDQHPKPYEDGERWRCTGCHVLLSDPGEATVEGALELHAEHLADEIAGKVREMLRKGMAEGWEHGVDAALTDPIFTADNPYLLKGESV